MTSDEKIRALCAQLLRAEDRVVLDTVSAELHYAVEEYVRSAKPPILVPILSPSRCRLPLFDLLA